MVLRCPDRSTYNQGALLVRRNVHPQRPGGCGMGSFASNEYRQQRQRRYTNWKRSSPVVAPSNRVFCLAEGCRRPCGRVWS